MRMYDGPAVLRDAGIAVSGLPADGGVRCRDVAVVVLDTLDAYIRLVLRSSPARVLGSPVSPTTPVQAQVEADFGYSVVELAGLCVRVCMHVRALDVLVTQVYDLFAGEDGRWIGDAFCSAVVQAVTTAHGGQWDLGNPVLVNRICEYILADEAGGGGLVERRRKLEEVIVRLDPACLDIHRVFSVCQREGLVVALIYLYSVALLDFQGPIIEVSCCWIPINVCMCSALARC